MFEHFSVKVSRHIEKLRWCLASAIPYFDSQVDRCSISWPKHHTTHKMLKGYKNGMHNTRVKGQIKISSFLDLDLKGLATEWI